MPDAPVIELCGVWKSYRLFRSPFEQACEALGIDRLLRRRTPPEFHALKNIDLQARRGARLGILGRNGAGKSTLLKLITGNIAPSRGNISISGTVQALIEIGLGFHPEFSGRQNITASLAYSGLDPDGTAQAADRIVEFCELGPFIDHPLKTYSSGMRARLYFACATAVRPDVLVIDEVLGAGDAYFAARSAERMGQLTGEGCTLLLVSHSTHQLVQFCNEGIWIEAGEIVLRGPIIEIVKAYEEFTRRMDGDRPPDLKGGAAEAQNEWFRRYLIGKVLAQGRQDDAAAVAVAPDNVTAGGVSRWPALPGVKVVGVTVAGERGSAAELSTGEATRVEITVAVETAGSYRCCYNVVIFTDTGIWLTRQHSPVDAFTAEAGDRRTVSLQLAPLLLGNGEYVFSVAVFDDTELTRLDEAKRYDLLSRSFRFRVRDRIADDESLFHHPGRWYFPQDDFFVADAADTNDATADASTLPDVR
jgi:lipopolysaccharide transport system ATP-binding protein